MMNRQQHQKPLILASKSPRRKELLEQLGLKLGKDFEIVPSSYKEEMDLATSPANSPAELVQYLAQKKAEDVAKSHPDNIVIGADTFIVLDDEIMGKARNEAQARNMLQKLSGKQHKVLTGLHIIFPESTTSSSDKPKSPHTSCTTSLVWFKNLSKTDIDWYIASGEPIGKAGGYAIQGKGAAFIDKIEGDFASIVGLPISIVYSLL